MRPVATVVAAGAVLLFIALGNWQLGRAAEKRAIDDDFSRAGPALPLPPASVAVPRYQRVTANGHYDAAHQFLLDNMSESGAAGVHVLTPLVLSDGSAVLVDRGWVPFGASRDALPDITVRATPRTISGRLDELPRPGIELAAPTGTGWPRLVSYPHMPELAAALGRELRPRRILLDAPDPDGYVRNWRVAGTSAERHLGYAIQWYAFAATAVAGWLALGLRRRGQET
ncbi:MAG: SURF1 family protein [Steroidobacteraceae bacterium]